MGSDVKYQTTEELERRIRSNDKWEATLVDRLNRWGPEWHHHKLNTVRMRTVHIKKELASRDAR